MPQTEHIPTKPLTWLVTGSSSGIGLVLTRHILAQGHNVIATSRNPNKTPYLVTEVESSTRGRWILLDVTRPEIEVRDIIDEAWKLFPDGVDVVVNNAAYSVLGSIEDIREAQVHANFQTNFIGVLRVIKAALPHMRSRGSGTIVNVSSLLGLATFPCCGIYGATKFALEGMSQALQQEVAPFGIRVLVPKFGSFRTNFLGGTAMQPVEPTTPYVSGPVIEALQAEYRKNGHQPGDPIKAVPILFDVVIGRGYGEGKERYLRLPLGDDAWQIVTQQAASLNDNYEAFREAAHDCRFDE